MNKPQVYKSNALVEASYRLSLYEQRIILSCISQVRRDEKLTDQKIYTITVKELSDNFGIRADRAYQHARKPVRNYSIEELLFMKNQMETVKQKLD